MKVAIIYNKDMSGVINQFGLQNKEKYNPKNVKLVAEALEKGGHNVRIIDGNMHVVESLHEFMPRVMEGEKMGMVFNMAYGIQGESRYTHLPSMLEMLGIPYVGSGPEGHALALDKVITKIVLQQHGIPTPKFWVFSTGDEDMSTIEYPVIVKPKMEAVSYGLRIVNNVNDLRDAVKFVIKEYQQQALVEKFIRGREFAIGLLGNGDLEAFPVLEIDLEGDPDAIQSAMDKLRKPRNKICPADIPQNKADEMIRWSKEAFKALGLRDFARVDIRMDENNDIYILEINSMASLGRTGAFVNAASVGGYSYTVLINKILDVSAIRYFSENLSLPIDLEELAKEKLPTTVRLRMFLRNKKDEIEKILKKMVNINTHVRNVEGVNELGQLLCKQLSPLGFLHRAYAEVEIGNILFLSNTHENEYDILFLTHLDNPTPFKKHVYFRQSDYKLYGSGVWDSKGGIAVMLAALRALRFSRILRTLRIGILLTTDDNLEGRISQHIIRDVSNRTKFVLGLYGASAKGSVVTSRSGAAIYDCQLNLVNPTKEFDVAKTNAKFTRLLNNISKLSNEEEKVIVNPRDVRIESNVTNLFAQGQASITVRYNLPEQAEEYDKKIHKLVKKAMSDKVQIQITGAIRRSPMVKNKEIEGMYKKVKSIAEKIDIRVLEEHRWSSSNMCFVNENKPRIDGLGPVGGISQEGEEYILHHSLFERAVLLALLLNSLRK